MVCQPPAHANQPPLRNRLSTAHPHIHLHARRVPMQSCRRFEPGSTCAGITVFVCVCVCAALFVCACSAVFMCAYVQQCACVCELHRGGVAGIMAGGAARVWHDSPCVNHVWAAGAGVGLTVTRSGNPGGGEVCFPA